MFHCFCFALSLACFVLLPTESHHVSKTPPRCLQLCAGVGCRTGPRRFPTHTRSRLMHPGSLIDLLPLLSPAGQDQQELGHLVSIGALDAAVDDMPAMEHVAATAPGCDLRVGGTFLPPGWLASNGRHATSFFCWKGCWRIAAASVGH